MEKRECLEVDFFMGGREAEVLFEEATASVADMILAVVVEIT